MTVLAVALAGALGAASRYVVDHLVASRTGRTSPWGTLVVNVTGSLAGGVVAGLVFLGDAPGGLHVVAGIGFAGSYTTFSTFAVDTVRLADQDRAAGIANVGANLLASLAAAGVGLAGVALLV